MRKRFNLKSDNSIKLGRYCEINGEQEISELKQGFDFRLPKYRREVFLKFYEFHLKYKSHPGAVYYVIPYLQKKLGMTKEQSYWFCFINGCTQNPCTSYVIFSNFPNFGGIDEVELEKWHWNNWKKLDYDIDRRYQKGHFVEMFINYRKILGSKTQVQYFEEYLCNSDNVFENFNRVWEEVFNKFFMFGRLSTFSYLEYLKIIGLNIDCPDLFLDDLSGSKSHRNGILKVCGRDDLDWHSSNGNITTHCKEIVEFVEKEGELLLEEAQYRLIDKPYFKDVNYFTLESTLCCYKSWHRKNRRYPNVYNDMFYNRIKKAESIWVSEIDFSIFWECRKDNLPINLRLEDCIDDVGLNPIKQNWYRETGQVIMMDKDFECFKNDYNG